MFIMTLWKITTTAMVTCNWKHSIDLYTMYGKTYFAINVFFVISSSARAQSKLKP